ncbi:MAG: sulfite exporter TauE/SafE family protein [Pseudolabrys sp.]
MPTEPLFYLIGLPAIFLVSLGRGAFGGGLAILGVPLLAFAVDPVTATFMMAPVVSASDPFTVWAFPPRTWSIPDLKWLVPGMIAGLCLGAVFVAEVDSRIVALGISIVILWFTARYFLRDRSTPSGHTPVNPVLALICSGLAGFTTFISHGGNPPIAYYLLPRGLPKTIYAGTMIALFLSANTVKLALYLWLNGSDLRLLLMAVALMPAVPLGVWAGKRLHDRLDQDRLYFWCYLLVGVAGLRLFVDSALKLIG